MRKNLRYTDLRRPVLWDLECGFGWTLTGN
jgi:hypothetical protein